MIADSGGVRLKLSEGGWQSSLNGVLTSPS